MHHCAHAAVQNGVFSGVELRAQHIIKKKTSWYLELHGAILESYVIGSVVLRVGRGAAGTDVIIADAQSAREVVGDGEIDG